jgi:hypothetical protein
MPFDCAQEALAKKMLGKAVGETMLRIIDYAHESRSDQMCLREICRSEQRRQPNSPFLRPSLPDADPRSDR